VLIKPGAQFPTTQVQACAPIQTRNATTRLDLRRQLLPGSIYAFEVAAIDAAGRVSSAIRTENFEL
jgi:hypothetical protein